MTTSALVLQALKKSTITDELRDHEIDQLAKVVTVCEFKAGETILQPGKNKLRDALLILGSGEVEVRDASGNGITLHLLQPGDLAGVIGFVGGDELQISATLVAKTDTKILLLDRARFESTMNSNVSMVAYYIMRGVVRAVHSIVRRMQQQTLEMEDYCFNQNVQR